MASDKQQTLFALDCGATNWRLYRVEYRVTGTAAQILGEPQPSSLTSFVDRKLPAVICLNPEGTALESFGEVAQQQLDDEQNRERVREYFKPCIGAYLEKNPLPHQKRYTHAQALGYTKMLLEALLDQIRQEKLRAAAFDDRVCFTFAYPVHWRYEHEGKVFEDFKRIVQECFAEQFDQIRFVAEPEGAILSLQHRGLLENQGSSRVTLIIDVGGSTTDIVAGEVDAKTGQLIYMGRYGEPFGGGLYDAELAKHVADDLKIPASALADDPSALICLRVFGQRLKESLSRQLLHAGQIDHVPQRAITLVMRSGEIYRRVIALDEARFKEITHHLDDDFEKLIARALETIAIQDQSIGQVVLVGGGAQLFSIIGYLRQHFGNQKVILADNPEEIVVQGIGLEYGASFEKKEPTAIFPVEPSKPDMSGQISTAPHESSWRLVSGENHIFPIPFGVTKIGRGETNDICVDDLKASRFHAEIQIVGDRLEVVDLDSTNGTFINGRRLSPNQPQILHHGDEVIFGKTKFICEQ